MKHAAHEIALISTAIDLGTAVAISFPDQSAANDLIVPPARPRAEQAPRVITRAHFEQMCAPSSDCI